MHIIAHRGFWQTETEKNTEAAFCRALENGFGIETDFRDCAGSLVISHDPPTGNEMPAEYFFKLYREYQTDAYLALNIKADGLQKEMKRLISKYDIKNYFVFDMSICDTIGYIEQEFKVFSRVSEYEIEIPFWDKSAGIWYDMFDSEKCNREEALSFYTRGKKVCIVSPELHGNPHRRIWGRFKELKDMTLMLCTDNPAEAETYFK